MLNILHLYQNLRYKCNDLLLLFIHVIAISKNSSLQARQDLVWQTSLELAPFPDDLSSHGGKTAAFYACPPSLSPQPQRTKS